ncbi:MULTISPECIES: DUF2282 domain-containing protein [unclassified Motilimonas]|uniref:BufA1 family periplasmic bufferin-type metallophore n=1 Tax=Motilimonas TaxID=1914248 RepID=UPI001E62C908|nr:MULTISPECIES: DUF2282 domain-containing protein [unclassified Motilimonas]MCE0557800.1 DUF2282 domain-containing protein [Motilimonas sp. E26]MDO6525899.1 DUF2282 domain-containing protein [Motilimonas sp. 1_MG-2023]
MKKSNIALASAISGVLALGATMISSPAMAAEKEKCYGVAKAGQNDCATKSSSCAGTSKVDNQGDAFIAVPKGLCEKLAGGSLEPKE